MKYFFGCFSVKLSESSPLRNFAPKLPICLILAKISMILQNIWKFDSIMVDKSKRRNHHYNYQGVWGKLHNDKPQRPTCVSTDPDVVRAEVFQLQHLHRLRHPWGKFGALSSWTWTAWTLVLLVRWFSLWWWRGIHPKSEKVCGVCSPVQSILRKKCVNFNDEISWKKCVNLEMKLRFTRMWVY